MDKALTALGEYRFCHPHRALCVSQHFVRWSEIYPIFGPRLNFFGAALTPTVHHETRRSAVLELRDRCQDDLDRHARSEVRAHYFGRLEAVCQAAHREVERIAAGNAQPRDDVLETRAVEVRPLDLVSVFVGPGSFCGFPGFLASSWNRARNPGKPCAIEWWPQRDLPPGGPIPAVPLEGHCLPELEGPLIVPLTTTF